MKGLEVKDITKHFGSVCALDRINLYFEENKIYGLLGRNGAGKSTLLNIITNRIFADNGEVLVDGETMINNDRALSKLYMINDKNYYPDNMKVKTIFEWTKSFYPEFDEAYAKGLADSFELNLNKTVKSLSTGYCSIFKLILALSVNTPYLLLDEPVLGLDANHREFFYKTLLSKYNDKPCTIIISTHLIDEVASVLEEIVIIKKGSVICNESSEALLSKGYTVSGGAAAVDAYTLDKKVLGVDALGGLKTAYILGKADQNIPVNLEINRLDLQKLFIEMTN